MASDHAALVARLEDAAVAHEYTASHLPREQAVEFAELTPAPAAVREPEASEAMDLEAQLREMWKDGFDTCRSYTDNWYHCEGEQRERRILAALARVKGQ
jgi:hypothetical protein